MEAAAARLSERGSDGYLKVLGEVLYVQTDEALDALFRETCPLDKIRLCALDAEWQPILSDRKTRGKTKPHSPAATVAQLALLDQEGRAHVVVLDLMEVSTTKACFYLTNIFDDSAIVKLGYGLWGDVKAVLLSTLPLESEDGRKRSDEIARFKDLCKSSCCFVDLLKLHGELINPRGSILGLQDLASVLLGCTLSKELQCSDWGLRPLSQEQIEYAALDAALLVDCFQKACSRLGVLELGEDPVARARGLAALLAQKFEERASKNRKQAERGKGKKKKKAQRKKNGSTRDPEAPSWYTQDCQGSPLKFICDEHLAGLAKQLRCCGLDCELAGGENSLREMVELAEKEDRIVLTSSPSLLRRNLVQKTMRVDGGSGRKSQLRFVLDSLALDPKETDLFTRCIKCNGSFERCDKGEIVEEIPAGILSKHAEFFRCTRCRKLYWEGARYNTALNQLKESLHL